VTPVESVLNQTRPMEEVVMVDGGSPDGPTSALERCPTVRVARQDHRGAGAARSTGIGATTGDYVKFLDCDDIWRPLKTASQIEYPEQSREALMLSGGKIWWDAASGDRHVMTYPSIVSARSRHESSEQWSANPCTHG
jgi:glycosyltransferase involved in cell wall biosynthesis